ncbi:hypothetical protein HMPREF3156_00070 [Neisseria sp. HMSC06F02]|nr:hypothetical protein HMPREF3156_00070 [Neisseria sp. HMSC06F02]
MDFEIKLWWIKFKSGQGTKPQTVQIVRQGEATLYRFKVKPLYIFRRPDISQGRLTIIEVCNADNPIYLKKVV